MKKCIEKNNINPDIECVHIACKINGKKDLTKYLLEKYKFDVDFESIYLAYHSTYNKPNSQFTYLFEKYYNDNKKKE